MKISNNHIVTSYIISFIFINLSKTYITALIFFPAFFSFLIAKFIVSTVLRYITDIISCSREVIILIYIYILKWLILHKRLVSSISFISHSYFLCVWWKHLIHILWKFCGNPMPVNSNLLCKWILKHLWSIMIWVTKGILIHLQSTVGRSVMLATFAYRNWYC